jgi:hypothetical protein
METLDNEVNVTKGTQLIDVAVSLNSGLQNTDAEKKMNKDVMAQEK